VPSLRTRLEPSPDPPDPAPAATNQPALASHASGTTAGSGAALRRPRFSPARVEPSHRFELYYPPDGPDDEEEYGLEEFGAPPASYKFCAPKRPKRPARSGSPLGGPPNPSMRSVMLSAEAIGDASIPTGQQRGVVKLTSGVASVPTSARNSLRSAAWCCVRLLSSNRNRQGYAPR
jgi:hypothetical protein